MFLCKTSKIPICSLTKPSWTTKSGYEDQSTSTIFHFHPSSMTVFKQAITYSMNKLVMQIWPATKQKIKYQYLDNNQHQWRELPPVEIYKVAKKKNSQELVDNLPVHSGQQWAGHLLSAHWSCCEHQSLRSQSQSHPTLLESGDTGKTGIREG